MRRLGWWRWWRRLSLRARLILLGSAGLAAGLALGGVALVAALGIAVERTVDSEALHTAQVVAQLVDEGTLPQPTPVAGDQIVQVVDAQHRVRSASINADRLVPLLREGELRQAREGRRLVVPGDRASLTGPLLVVGVPAGPPDDPQTVIVARSLTEVRHSVALLRTALLVMYPLLLVPLALVGWRVVGAALRPVEALRSGAERITDAATAERLPVPASQDEIGRLAVTLNDMLDRLVAARARQRAFVADAAHELRSPLANMRTQLEVAQRLRERAASGGAGDGGAGDGGAGDGGLVADLLVDIERLSRLVDDLLLLARADERAPAVRAEPVELGTLLREVAGRYEVARVPVTFVSGAPAGTSGEPVWTGAEPVWTSGEPAALTRVFTNLLDNAVRHAERRVLVEVRPGAGEHLVSITDDGPGIPEIDRERVFDRFTRLDDARARDSGGSGLGLAIVRELVRRHGGSVRLDDARPGLRAEVRVPAEDGPSAISIDTVI